MWQRTSLKLEYDTVTALKLECGTVTAFNWNVLQYLI